MKKSREEKIKAALAKPKRAKPAKAAGPAAAAFPPAVIDRLAFIVRRDKDTSPPAVREADRELAREILGSISEQQIAEKMAAARCDRETALDRLGAVAAHRTVLRRTHKPIAQRFYRGRDGAMYDRGHYGDIHGGPSGVDVIGDSCAVIRDPRGGRAI